MSRTRQATPGTGSNSQVQTAPQSPENTANIRISGTLRLRGEDLAVAVSTDGEAASVRRIRWSEDVVDNEGMGKKSSKVCCIYHKSRPAGESSSESESSDSESSDTGDNSDVDHRGHGANCSHRASHRGREPNDHQRPDGEKRKRRKPSPNAYERMPKPAKNYTKAPGL